jgi:hypothetical protein
MQSRNILPATKNPVLRRLMLASTILVASVFPAAALTYYVDETIGLGSVVGTVTTNGSIGNTLGSSIFTAWDLNLNGVGASVEIKNTDAGAVVWGSGLDIKATATQLLFNYGAGNQGFLVFQIGQSSGQDYWCLNAGNSACLSSVSEFVVPVSYLDASSQSVSGKQGTQVFASITSGIPEASTWMMLLLGFVRVGFAAYRRKSNHAFRFA